MKKRLVAVVAVLLLTAPLMAKSVNDKGTFNLQVGVGLSPYALAWGGAYSSYDGFYYVPPITVSGNWGIMDLVSVGFLAAFETFGYSGTGYDYSLTYIMVGPRADFHFNRWLKVNNLDVYVGLSAGLNLWLLDSRSSDVAVAVPFFYWQAHVGVKYYFTDLIGIWAEAGYGYSILSAGVVFRF